MFKTIKRALPVTVFITLATGSMGLSLQASPMAILTGGLGAALVTALLLYAVINWDDAFQHKRKETLQLASVVNHTMDAVVIFDARGRVLYANPSAQDTYELKDRSDCPADITILGLSAIEGAAVREQVLGGGGLWHGEITRIGTPGKQRVDLVGIFRLDEFQGHLPALVSISRDLTARKHLERRLQHSQKLAAVGELAAGIAHEINNPMAAIQSQVGLAGDLLSLHGGGDSSPEVLKCLGEADRQIKRCSNIVDSLLRFSRHDGVRLTCMDPRSPVQQAVEFVRCLSRMQRLQLTCTLDEGLPRIQSDPDSVTQILVNLIINAADATHHCGPVQVRCRRYSDEFIAMEVADGGSGIAAEIRDRIFEPFFTTKSPGAGTGLGLSISYGLARALGGELHLEGRRAGGTCATLCLPVRGPSAAANSRSAAGGTQPACH